MTPPAGTRRRVLTWHVHGTYLQQLGTIGHEIFVPVREGRPTRYAGLPPGRRWPQGLIEVPAEQVRDLDLDCLLFQTEENVLIDQQMLLDDRQKELPKVFLEHDPPGHDGSSCFDTRHPVGDPSVHIVHVTPFNDLMWDSGASRTTVIEHGVAEPKVAYRGSRSRGLVVVNHLEKRGRRLGFDVFERVRREIPLDLIGLDSERSGGLGEVPSDEVASFAADYRFFFHPIRYTSLGLALCEAMMMGMPVVALATTEAPTVITDGVDGFTHTDVDRLIADMERLIADVDLATAIGEAGRATARRRFGLARFQHDWRSLIEEVVTGEPAVAGAEEVAHPSRSSLASR